MMTIGKDDFFVLENFNDPLNFGCILDDGQNISYALIVFRFINGIKDGIIHTFFYLKRRIGI